MARGPLIPDIVESSDGQARARGELHSKGSESGLRALIVQVRELSLLAPEAVRDAEQSAPNALLHHPR